MLNMNDRAWRIAAVLMASVASIVFVMTAWAVIRYANAVPYGDQWRVVADMERLWSGEYTLADLFRQHNEHRIVFRRLVFYLDNLLFGGRNTLNYIVMISLQLVHATLLFWLFRRSALSLTAIQSVAVFAFIITMLFSLSQYENFLWGFQVTFIGVYVAATGALVCMVRAHARDNMPASGYWIAAAILLAIVATFSMANGMLIWPLLIAYALYYKLGRAVLAPLIVVAVFAIGGYMFDFQYPENHSAPAVTLQHPFFYVIYVLTYLGNSFGSAGAVLGLIGLTALVLSLIVAMRFRPLAPAQTALIAVSLFVFGASLLTGVGRLKFSIGHATVSRYTTPSTIFWVAQFLFWMSLGATDGIRRRGAILALFATVTVISGLMMSHFASIAIASDRMLRQAVASDALVVGVRDGEMLRRLYPDAETILALRLTLERRSLSVFSEPVVAHLGRPLAQTFKPADIGRCEGNMSAAAPVSTVSDEGWRLSGWARDVQEAGLPQRIVIADSRGLIAGLASVGHPYDSESGAPPAGADTGWTGYAKSAYPPFTAYALLDDGATVCALACASVDISACAAPGLDR